MKKIFAVTLALIVVPSFHAHAWIGGPFNNNSFTPEGDDGIYEAIAIPVIGSGMGLYRWGVNNRSAGGTQFTNGLQGGTGNVLFGGMVGNFNQHIWYFNGETYFGPCYGSVNSGVGTVSCVGTAATAVPRVTSPAQPNHNSPFTLTQAPNGRFVFDRNGNIIVNPATGIPIISGVGDVANSRFRGQIQPGNYNHASRRFSGRGELTADVFGNGAFQGIATTVRFRVFGSRVSLSVTG